MLRFCKDALDCITTRIDVGQPSQHADPAFSDGCRVDLHEAEMIDPSAPAQEHPLRVRPRICPLLDSVAVDDSDALTSW